MEASTNLGRVSLVPRGEYDPASQYDRLDVVEYQGSSFLVLRSVQGVSPVNGEDYMLVASKGDIGSTGAKGDKGDKGDTGDQGIQGEVGPQGAQGIQGPPGPQGINGVAVAADGVWAFNVDEAGHLILNYTGDEAPNAEIREDGHLYLTI